MTPRCVYCGHPATHRHGSVCVYHVDLLALDNQGAGLHLPTPRQPLEPAPRSGRVWNTLDAELADTIEEP